MAPSGSFASVTIAALALTFDDGPDERGTPAILDALRDVGATASFFVVAPRVRSRLELVRRIVDDGHAIGLHCDAHVRHGDRDRVALVADTERALATLRRAHVAPTLWRTPWGATAPFTAGVARAHGLRLVGWDVDTHDWRGDTAQSMFATTRHRLTSGAIVLAHDGIGPGARREDCRETAGYVRLAASHAAERGLAMRALRAG